MYLEPALATSRIRRKYAAVHLAERTVLPHHGSSVPYRMFDSVVSATQVSFLRTGRFKVIGGLGHTIFVD